MSNYKSTPDRRISIAAKYINALSLFAATNDLRYFLSGILIEPHPDGGIIATATNGHILATIHDKDGSADGCYVCSINKALIAATEKKRVKKKSKHVNQPAIVDFVGDLAFVSSDGQDPGLPTVIDEFNLYSGQAKAIDHEYLDWRRVFRDNLVDTTPQNHLSLNPRYIGIASDAISALCGYRGQDLSIFTTGKNGVFVLRSSIAPELVMILMPTATDIKEPVPSWIGAGDTEINEEAA